MSLFRVIGTTPEILAALSCVPLDFRGSHVNDVWCDKVNCSVSSVRTQKFLLHVSALINYNDKQTAGENKRPVILSNERQNREMKKCAELWDFLILAGTRKLS